MQRIVAATALFALFAVGTQLGTAQGQSSPQLLLQGRFYPGPDSSGYGSLPQTISWSASTVIAYFQGASTVTVTIAALPAKYNVTFASGWFRFYVDDQPVQDGFTSYNAPILTVPLQTPGSGTHSLRIVKMNEGTRGEAILQSISLNSGSFITPPQGLPQRRILMLGNSFLSGFGDTAAGHPEWCAPTASQVTSEFQTTCTALKIFDTAECGNYVGGLNENSAISFGPLTATALDADYQIISASGSGMVGYAYIEALIPGKSMQEYETLRPSNEILYNRSVYSQPNATYQVQSWIPQVVVISSGTNDWNARTGDYTQDTWVQQAANFLSQISKDFNSPVIVLVMFPLTRADGQGFQEGTTYQDAINALYKEGQKRNIPNLQLLKISNLSDAAVSNWCLNHPSAQAHVEVAQQLTDLLSSTGLKWPQSNAISLLPTALQRPSTALYTGGSNPFQGVQAPSQVVALGPAGASAGGPVASRIAGLAPTPAPSQNQSRFQTPPSPPPSPSYQPNNYNGQSPPPPPPPPPSPSPPPPPSAGNAGGSGSGGGGSFWNSITGR